MLLQSATLHTSSKDCSQCSTCWLPLRRAIFSQKLLFQGHCCSCNHCNTSRWPSAAAPKQAALLQGAGGSCPLAHDSTFSCPVCAAYLVTPSSQGHPCCRAHCSTSRCPRAAAAVHAHAFQGQGCTNASDWPPAAAPCLSHCSTSSRPSRAAAMHAPAPHGQGGCWQRAHCKICRWPAPAAAVHTLSSHLQPACLAQASTAQSHHTAKAVKLRWNHSTSCELSGTRWQCTAGRGRSAAAHSAEQQATRSLAQTRILHIKFRCSQGEPHLPGGRWRLRRCTPTGPKGRAGLGPWQEHAPGVATAAGTM